MGGVDLVQKVKQTSPQQGGRRQRLAAVGPTQPGAALIPPSPHLPPSPRTVFLLAFTPLAGIMNFSVISCDIQPNEEVERVDPRDHYAVCCLPRASSCADIEAKHLVSDPYKHQQVKKTDPEKAQV